MSSNAFPPRRTRCMRATDLTLMSRIGTEKTASASMFADRHWEPQHSEKL